MSMILLFHRLLYRFFTRLRATLLAPSSLPFRQRNPLISKTLTFSLAPALGASLSGFWLGLYEKGDLRLTLAIYTASRAAELAWNAAESKGLIWGKFTKGQGEGGSYGWKKGWERPWWWGSWMLMPLACGQLLHAFVFDRDCFPTVCEKVTFFQSNLGICRVRNILSRKLQAATTEIRTDTNWARLDSHTALSS